MTKLIGKLAPALTLAIAGLGAPVVAEAAYITQTFTHVSSNSAYTYNFGVALFNPNQGTLTSVVISMTSKITGQADVYNSGATAQAFTGAMASVSVTLSGPNYVGLGITAGTQQASGTVAADVAGVSGHATVTGLMVTASAGTTLGMASQYAGYIGTGSNLVNFSYATQSATFSGNGASGVTFGGAAGSDGTITITYNYTPPAVPEPGTLSLLGVGGVAGLLIRRRLSARV